MDQGTFIQCLALAGLALLFGRQVLAWDSLRQLKRLAGRSFELQRCWANLATIPSALLTPPMRLAIGKTLAGRLRQARRIRPHHPYLNVQHLQIARLVSGAAWGISRENLSRRERAAAISSLEHLVDDLDWGGRQRLLTDPELDRARFQLLQATARLQVDQYTKAAEVAQHLRRWSEAASHLRHALGSAERLPNGESLREQLAGKLKALDSVPG